MKPNELRTLGRSGLAVSPLTLGTMTMGNTEWGSPDEESSKIFHRYVDAGGNSIDTADVYAGGRSEELVGRFLAERNLRDHVVLGHQERVQRRRQQPTGRRREPEEHPPGAGGVAAAARDGLHRPVLAARLGPGDSGRGDPADLRRPGAQRPDPLLRLLGTCRPGSPSARPPWPRRMACRARSPCSSSTRWWNGPSSASTCRPRDSSGWASCRGARWPADSWPASTPRLKPEPTGQGRLSGNNPFGDSKFSEHNWRVLEELRTVADELGHPRARSRWPG